MDKKNEIGIRIVKCRKESGMTQEELANSLGLNKSTIQRYESGKIEKIKLPIIEAMANVLGVRPEYLAGKTDISDNIEILPSSEIHIIPVYETVSAGLGAYADDHVIGHIPLHIENKYDVPDMMCIKVSGDSMFPKIENGDIIVVRRQSSVDNGQIAVILVDGEEGIVKSVNAGENYIELLSINPMYPPRRFEGKDVERVRIVGLVKQIIKNV